MTADLHGYPGFNPFPIGSYLFGPGNTQFISFTAAATGQYAIGVSRSNETCVNGSAFTVQLSGNTASVPEPATWALLALSVAALAAARRRDERPSMGR